MKLLIRTLVLSSLLPCTSYCAAAPLAAFVSDGQLLIYQDDRSRGLDLFSPLGTSPTQHRVSDYWGRLGDQRLVVSLEPNEARDVAAEEDHHCSNHSPGYPAWLVRTDGALESLICTNVLRAYPAPTGDRIALISPERDLSIWHNDACTTVSVPGKVSNAGWSPDGRRLVMSVYPPDWSVGAVSHAATTADFLRLQNADLYLLDVESGEVVSQLTNDPGTEYGAFFSPDGSELYYNWAHLTDDIGGLMRLVLDRDGGTSASQPAAQLTQAGNDPGETPLGRVTTYIWNGNQNQLVFEAGLPDGSGEIWVMTREGKSSERLAAGRKPQRLEGNRVVFQQNDGTPQVLQPEVRP